MHLFGGQLTDILSTYGYWAVMLIVMCESAGLPLPGETILVTAAIVAGHDHTLSLPLVVGAAALGAMVGDNIGFWVGRKAGIPLLRNYGSYLGIDAGRIRIGEYLFRRHGGKIVFFGRFVAVLRALAALLAGANRYAWPQFLFWNAAGAILWASLFGTGGFFFGKALHRVTGPVGIAGLVLAVAAMVFGFWFVRHHEKDLQARADAAAGCKKNGKDALSQNPAQSRSRSA